MKNLFIKILFLQIILKAIFASDITVIQISGNIKTNNQLILTQIQHPIDIPFNKNIAKEDIKRLEKLNVFETIEISNQNNIYFVSVKEKKAAIYSPIIDKIDGLGWSIGANIDVNNIRGTLNNANLIFKFGAINTQSFKYNHNSISLEYINNQSGSIESDYLRNESNIFLIYNLKDNLFLQGGTTRNILDYKESELKKYNYFNSSINFSKKTKKYLLKAYIAYNTSLNNSNPNYSKLFFKYDNNITVNNNNIISNIILRTQVVLNTCDENFIIDYENLYFGGDDYVRGFHPNPLENSIEISDYLKFRNMIFQSIQLELPIAENQFFNSKLLLFHDFAIGSNNYKKFNYNKKIKGFGIGVSITTIYDMRFDVCFGLNHYGKQQMHFMKNINF